MPAKFARTGDPVHDRNLDEIARVLRDEHPPGQIGGTVSLASGANRIKPAVAHPRGRVTVFLSPGSVTITDVGLDSGGYWNLTASGAATARFLWLV